MLALYKIVLLLGLLEFVHCTRKTEPGLDERWPIIYYNDGVEQPTGLLESAHAAIQGSNRILDEESLVPIAQEVSYFNATSDIMQDAIFHAQLARTSNCRASFDKWDCENCTTILSDGVAVRPFTTFPLGVTGNIVKSEKEKKLFVMIRTASSLRNKILFFRHDLVPHPLIPGAKVQIGLLQSMLDIRNIVYRAVKDQLTLHPDYKVHVTGHSFGAGVGSLLTVDLFQRLENLNSTNLEGYLLGKTRVGDFAYAKYVADNNIPIKRFVTEADDFAHRPNLLDGYVHEGDEYWLKSTSPMELVHCPGPFETRNCSNSVKSVKGSDTLNYFGVFQECENDIFNLY